MLQDAIMAIISMTPDQLQAMPPDQRIGLTELVRLSRLLIPKNTSERFF